MRTDSGLVNYAPPRAIARRGGTFSVAATMQAHVRVAIEAIPNEQWTPILAVLAALIAYRPHLPHWLHPLIAVGFWGSLTTFAGLEIEAFLMMRDGRSGGAVVYVLVSIALGLVAAVAGRRAVATVHT